jgi:hypothetical protein
MDNNNRFQVDIEVISVETHLAGQVYPGSREDILQLLVDQVIIEGHGLPWLQGGYSSAFSGSGNHLGSWSTLAPGRIFFSS